MGIISRIFQREQSLPWTDDSVFNAIRSHLDPASGSLLTQDIPLPDDEPVNSSTKIRFVSGALDGVFGHHGRSEQGDASAGKIARLLDRVSRTGAPAALSESYNVLKDSSVLEVIDEVVRQLSKGQTPFEPLKTFALHLATRSRDRGPVKAGIALLGITRSSEHQDVVMTLGKHDEFTLYSAVALRKMLSDPVPALWELARHVHGWGRIQIVERLGRVHLSNLSNLFNLAVLALEFQYRVATQCRSCETNPSLF